MAAKEVLKKHFNCQICLDQYNNPRRLTCGHVYCHGCVDDLIRRTAAYYWIRRGREQVFGFKCPECRIIIKIPRPEEPSERWVLQINKDFKLDDILADLKELTLQNEVKEREKEENQSLPKEVEIRTAAKISAVQGIISKDSTLAPATIAEVIEHENASEQAKGGGQSTAPLSAIASTVEYILGESNVSKSGNVDGLDSTMLQFISPCESAIREELDCVDPVQDLDPFPVAPAVPVTVTDRKRELEVKVLEAQLEYYELKIWKLKYNQ